MSAGRPLLLAAPGRFAGWRAGPARAVLAALALLLTAMALLGSGKPVEPAPLNGRMTDLALYQGIASGVRGGGNYYQVTADALRAGGYPLRPFMAFRLPTLSLVLGWLPRGMISSLMLALVIATALAWAARLRAAMAGVAGLAIALVLLAAGMLAAPQPDLMGFHEIWAGLLIALSLALRRPGRWIDSAAVGLCAMLIRETAVAYALLMLALALVEGQRREATGWAVAIGLFAAVLGFHAWAVAQVTGPLDPVSPGWLGMQGVGFAAGAVAAATALGALPPVLAAVLVALALFGWSGWRDPLAVRAGLLILGYGAMLAIFARGDTFYWALIVAPLSLVGLAFVPDAIRDLVRSALDRRMVTVTKVAR